MDSAFLIIATFCYAVGTVGYLIYLARDWTPIHWASWGALALGALAHGVGIGLRSWAGGQLAVTTSPEALSFFTWLLVCTYVIVQLRLNLRILGSFVSPLAVLFMIACALVPANIVPESPIFQSSWLIVHVVSLFLAYALFALAFSGGVMYLLQERQIKQKRIGFCYRRLPPLERLDRINHTCLLAGFPLMTIGLVAGFLYAPKVWYRTWTWDPKEIAAVITWLIYAILLHERLAVGWRGRRAAWLAIFGFSAVLVTFLGVNLFSDGHHRVFSIR